MSSTDQASITDAPAPQPSRTDRAAKTWLYGLGYTAVTTVIGLVATPVLVRYLGAERLGIHRAAGEWLGYLTLADFGTAGAISVLILRARSAGLAHALRGSARYGIRVLSLLVVLMIALGLPLAWVLPWLIQTPAELIGELRLAGFISLAGLCLIPFAVYRALLETAQRGYVVHAALLIQSVITTGLAVWLAMAGYGLVGQAIAVVSGAAAGTALIVACSWRELLGAGSGDEHPPAREVWQLSWPIALAGIANRFNLMTDAVIVGLFLGGGAVAQMFLTQRLIALVGGQINGFVNASWAGLAQLRSVSQEAFQRGVAKLLKLVVGGGVVVTGTAAVLNARFVGIWVGDSLFAGHVFSMLTMASTVLFGFIVSFAFIIDTHGDTRRRLWASMAGGVLTVGLGALLVPRIGLVGIPIARIIGMGATDAIRCPIVMARHYGISPSEMLRAVGYGFAFGLPWVGVVSLIELAAPIDVGFAANASGIILMLTAALAYCGLVFLEPADRAKLLRKLRRR